MQKLDKQRILAIAGERGKVTTKFLAGRFRISRQYASMLIRELVRSGSLTKIGSTRKSYYVVPEKNGTTDGERYAVRLSNRNLEEHAILRRVRQRMPSLGGLAENVLRCFEYMFSEMMNNAIEHSKARTIWADCECNGNTVSFSIRDSGIGVFRNVMHSRSLQSETEAMQDLLKGKTTTQPEKHTGEGIFFTSKTADLFVLESYGYVLRIDNRRNDVFFGLSNDALRGTRVSCSLDARSPRELADIFRKYTDGSAVFSTTEIIVRLYQQEGPFVSRSEARRLLQGLEKFTTIILDFDRVSMVGQAFVDEVFRVFKASHPAIAIRTINTSEPVAFMIRRAEGKP